jgi:signal transduction histidine kinase
MPQDFAADVAAIQSIDAVPTILDVVCRITGMGFAAVARVTEDRWVACTVLDNIDFGLKPGGELKVETTICNEIRTLREVVVIDHVAEDDVFRHHHTPAMYGFQSYISMPIIRRDGSLFGTLCAIDPRPAKLNNPEVIGMFKLFAELIASHLDSQQLLQTTRKALEESERVGALREQFVAVLGHDLRNAVASIGSGSNIILRTTKEEKTRQVATLIQGSVLRMTALIGNVMDFARSRLGEGIKVEMRPNSPLQPALEQVLNEARMVHPGRQIDVTLDINDEVSSDHNRVARLFGNLLSNSLHHGAKELPVVVEATTRDGTFELSVANGGTPIPPDAMDALFQPFYRGRAKSGSDGLGLGLYIASEIAQVHGGKLEAVSNDQETRFTFTMPTDPSAEPGVMRSG